jgi:hypothetical protein
MNGTTELLRIFEFFFLSISAYTSQPRGTIFWFVSRHSYHRLIFMNMKPFNDLRYKPRTVTIWNEGGESVPPQRSDTRKDILSSNAF